MFRLIHGMYVLTSSTTVIAFLVVLVLSTSSFTFRCLMLINDPNSVMGGQYSTLTNENTAADKY